MRPSSRPTPRARPKGRAWLGLTLAVSLGLVSSSALGQPGVTPQVQMRRVPSEMGPLKPIPDRLNPSDRAVVLTVPVKDNNIYLGDIGLTIGTDDSLSFSAQRFVDLVSTILSGKATETLRAALAGKTAIGPGDLEGSGLKLTYNPRTLDLTLFAPSALRAEQSLSIAALDQARFGGFEKPAKVSAYLNVHGSGTYVERGASTGWDNPVFFLDGAARLGAVVFENDMVVQPGAANGHDVQRQGTRVIYDDRTHLIRWTGYDLQPVGRGFQTTQDMAGLSVFRSYSVLAPQTFARPRGGRTFSLDSASSVEVYVNGLLVRRVQLAPGTYNLTDFPFTQGANDFRLAITDSSGRNQVLRFNLFIEQTQLAEGLSEFGLYAGVKAPLGLSGPQYTDQWQVSGFYRRGVRDDLTVGINLQADERAKMIGLEEVWGSRFGVIGSNLALSDIQGYGSGYAVSATFQRLVPRGPFRTDSLSLSLESHSRDFGGLGTEVPRNPYVYELGAGYTHSFTDRIYGGIDAHYSSARAGFSDVQTYRATLGWRLSPTLSLTTDLVYDDKQGGRDVAALFSLTRRFASFSSLRADYDTRNNDMRASYQAQRGAGVGSSSLSADLDRNDDGSGLNLAANYIANRAELGVNHFSAFKDNFGGIDDQRTSLRLATSLAFADGAVAVGRPIYDAFAIVVPYKSLKQARVLIDPEPHSYQASTGWLGAALEPNLSAYNVRAFTVGAPMAPPGTDVGKGAYRVFAPYRAGYRFQVGSDYSMTAVGQLVDEDQTPVSLTSGQAFELARPKQPALTVFTNREGRFGLTGLRPGRWRVEMLTNPVSSYVLDIHAGDDLIVQAGTLHPTGATGS